MQKAKEWIVAIKLERQYTKNEIIAMYLNTQGFLFNAIGIRSAARIYFGKEPKDLDLQESAILVAMLKNPRQYNPNREVSKKEITKQKECGFCANGKKRIYYRARKRFIAKITIKNQFYTPESHNDGLATYFREYLRARLKKWVKENPKPNGELYNINRDGLKIYVTLDSRMQQYAQEAMSRAYGKSSKVTFHKEHKKKQAAPFYDLEDEQIESIYLRARRNSDRYTSE